MHALALRTLALTLLPLRLSLRFKAPSIVKCILLHFYFKESDFNLKILGVDYFCLKCSRGSTGRGRKGCVQRIWQCDES